MIASFMTMVAVALLADRATSHGVEPLRAVSPMFLLDRVADAAADETADREVAYPYEGDEAVADRAADRADDRAANYEAADESIPVDRAADLAADLAADRAMDLEADYAVAATDDDIEQAARALDREADAVADRDDDREAGYAVAASLDRAVENAWAAHVADVEADRLADREANYPFDDQPRTPAEARRVAAFSPPPASDHRAARPFAGPGDITGGSAILPSGFVPYKDGQAMVLVEPVPRPDIDAPREAMGAAPRSTSSLPSPLPPEWSMPLMERALGPTRKAESLAPELQNAINRIEPIFDPTRVEGSVDAVVLRVSAGTAALVDVFGERWRLAADDPTIDLKVSRLGLAWRVTPALPCDAYTKKRRHEVGEVALTALSTADCARLRQRQAIGFDDAAPIPVVSAPISLATFAAPMPGARLSSEDFWAAQKARIDIIEARLQQRLHPPVPSPEQLGLRL